MAARNRGSSMGRVGRRGLPHVSARPDHPLSLDCNAKAYNSRPNDGGRMTELSALWLPMVVSAVFVFIASSITHMGPFWHRSDYPRLTNEDRVLDALRP